MVHYANWSDFEWILVTKIMVILLSLFSTSLISAYKIFSGLQFTNLNSVIDCISSLALLWVSEVGYFLILFTLIRGIVSMALGPTLRASVISPSPSVDFISVLVLVLLFYSLALFRFEVSCRGFDFALLTVTIRLTVLYSKLVNRFDYLALSTLFLLHLGSKIKTPPCGRSVLTDISKFSTKRGWLTLYSVERYLPIGLSGLREIIT